MPQAIAITRHQGMEAVELVAPDGARATVLLHGAHVLSWIPAGADEQLYVSPKTAYASGQAVRGGVPVVFPQFAERGPLQKHGFARTKPWQLVSAEQGEDDALAVLRLRDDAATRMLWPHAFEAELSVRVAGRTLEIELACENRGEAAFSFATALHSYLRLGDLDAASLAGLSGLRYFDSVDRSEKTQRVELLLPSGELDRIYEQVLERELTLHEQLPDGSERRLLIRQQGFEDAVVWNPGADKCAALADMPADGFRQMLCVEAATIMRPIELQPGESWAGMQILTLL
ncbi:D-hexose-6-phosphate mutarotase [Roseateles violae]|uniref:Putative glucose-6-phosphate 1-epimerase n=1 Tax=Roseateles violae TaxID=3058042 RepID=A0ABT8DRB6_9BURK|nr:D-hexose-6-phosphate mutarotase [Pelomonas sp. PFR6]MDN3919618.1 D-hexose-6-phosphate mutarotase [Pelomonas sp. PFR6]